MELIQTDSCKVNGREFKIYTYRDTDNDSLVIMPEESKADKKNELAYLKAYVHMKGVFDLPPKQYPGYEEALMAVKNALHKL